MRALLLLALFASLPALADTLVFKDGKKMEGKVIGEDAETVFFERKGGIKTKFKKDEIAEIIKSDSGLEPAADDPEAALRKARLTPTGDATLDPLRKAASDALTALVEKRGKLQAAAKKTEAQTKSFENQMKKVKQMELEAEKLRAKWKTAEERRIKAQEVVDKAQSSGQKVTREQEEDLEMKKKIADGHLRPAEAAEAKVTAESKKLEEARAKYDAAAFTLKPAVAEVQAAAEALDTAWGALAEAERDALAKTPAWISEGEGAAVVRIEGRVVKHEDGVLTLATGAELDPSKWKTEVAVAAPAAALKPGDVVLVVARREPGGWVAMEVNH